jgi:voltage-gated potassium channel
MKRKEVLTRFWVTLFLLLVLMGIGVQVYHSLEGWSYLDSAYFTVITITTIGYGDFFL